MFCCPIIRNYLLFFSLWLLNCLNSVKINHIRDLTEKFVFLLVVGRIHESFKLVVCRNVCKNKVDGCTPPPPRLHPSMDLFYRNNAQICVNILEIQHKVIGMGRYSQPLQIGPQILPT